MKHFSRSLSLTFGNQSSQMSLHKPETCSETQVFLAVTKLLHALISEPASLELTSSDKRQVTIHQNRTR